MLAQAQPNVIGKWNTVDDDTGEIKAVVDIFERNGRIYGRIIQIMNREFPDPICEKCEKEDNRHKKRIIGMEIIRDLQRSGDSYSGGNILDPEDGKIYRCKIWIEGNNLMVRGYWGPFYRTQEWRKSS